MFVIGYSGNATAKGVCLPINKPLDRVLGNVTARWFQAFVAGTCDMFTMLIVGHVVCPVQFSMVVCAWWLLYDSVAPGVCTPCGLLSLLSHVSLTMCFRSGPCGMMDISYLLFV